MALKVRMSSTGKVDAIEDDTQPTWVEGYQALNLKLPPLLNWMLPVVNNYTKDARVSQDIEVIPCSGQYWQGLRSDQKAELLELVEWLGGNADEFVRNFEAMYPKDPSFHKRSG